MSEWGKTEGREGGVVGGGGGSFRKRKGGQGRGAKRAVA